MRVKTGIAILLTAILALLSGWFLNSMFHFSGGILQDGKKLDSLRLENSQTATLRENLLDSLQILANTCSQTDDFASEIKGRFVMKDANCAGFDFISPTRVSWTNEIQCNHPDTFKIRWLNNSTFYTQDIVRLNENCPPRVWIYQVISFDGKQLVLKDIWTSWEYEGKTTDARLEFEKREW